MTSQQKYICYIGVEQRRFFFLWGLAWSTICREVRTKDGWEKVVMRLQLFDVIRFQHKESFGNRKYWLLTFWSITYVSWRSPSPIVSTMMKSMGRLVLLRWICYLSGRIENKMSLAYYMSSTYMSTSDSILLFLLLGENQTNRKIQFKLKSMVGKSGNLRHDSSHSLWAKEIQIDIYD